MEGVWHRLGAVIRPRSTICPTKWVDYTGFDVMIVSLNKLETLVTKHPAQWSAIRDWLHNGGNLIVYGVGKKWQELDKLQRLLGLDDSNRKPEPA